MVAELRAVFVGINTYQDIRYRERSLRYARADAEELAATLHNSRVFYIDDNYFPVLTNERATHKSVWDNLHRVFPMDRDFDSHVIALFYFAGHSFIDPIDKTSILLGCHDVEVTDPHQGGIRLNDIYNLLLRSSAGCSIAIIDSCFSGGITDMTKIDYDSPVEQARQAITLLRGGNDKTLAIFAACRANEEAREEEALGHGIYTHELLSCLNDESPARDERGVVDLKGVDRYLSLRFKNGTQRPRSTVLGGDPVDLWHGEPRITPQEPVEPLPIVRSGTYLGGENLTPLGKAPTFRESMRGAAVPIGVGFALVLLIGLLAVFVEPVRFGFFILLLVISMLLSLFGFAFSSVVGILLVLLQTVLLIGVGHNHFHWFASVSFLTPPLGFIGGLEWLFWTLTIVEILFWMYALIFSSQNA